jgi:organic hydroperoxide reductase OsmC/OhrA
MRLEVQFHRIEGTGAFLGRSGRHTIVADRREGAAGGASLGFSGGELQALALGAGYGNQLAFSAAELGLEITDLAISVALDVEDDLLAGATIGVRLAVASGPADAARLKAHADANSTISNSVTRGFPVAVALTGIDIR